MDWPSGWTAQGGAHTGHSRWRGTRGPPACCGAGRARLAEGTARAKAQRRGRRFRCKRRELQDAETSPRYPKCPLCPSDVMLAESRRAASSLLTGLPRLHGEGSWSRCLPGTTVRVTSGRPLSPRLFPTVFSKELGSVNDRKTEEPLVSLRTQPASAALTDGTAKRLLPASPVPAGARLRGGRCAAVLRGSSRDGVARGVSSPVRRCSST